MAGPLIVGNWKMNGSIEMLAEIGQVDHAASSMDLEVGLAPPFTLTRELARAFPNIQIGGQDCHSRSSGPFTGDVSARMLVECGARFVILGHSERRAQGDLSRPGHGEANTLIREKVETAVRQGLKVILCVGETREEREAGRALEVVREQVQACFPTGLVPDDSLVIAYEPVWSIGTGLLPKTEDIRAMHEAIDGIINGLRKSCQAPIRILYGGSVNPANARKIIAIDRVGGFLVGGASLKAEDFLSIMRAANDHGASIGTS